VITRRLTLSLLIALGISGLCTYVLGQRIGSGARTSAATRMYVAPARPLASGELLKADDVKLIAWPSSQPVAGGFEAGGDVVGRIVLYPVNPGQPLTDRLVSAPGAGTGLAARIPEGMRAIALKSDDVVGVAGFLSPGSHLDVLVTFRTEKQPEPTTLTVLQDAEVLAAGHQAQPDPEGKPSTVTVVTLLLTPGDAERVVLASTQGTIHFVLRSGSDQVRTHEGPISLSQLSPLPLKNVADLNTSRPKGFRAITRQLEPARFQVETIRGDKATTVSFSEEGAR
jgi:pilus assembly protein CpaB